MLEPLSGDVLLSQLGALVSLADISGPLRAEYAPLAHDRLTQRAIMSIRTGRKNRIGHDGPGRMIGLEASRPPAVLLHRLAASPCDGRHTISNNPAAPMPPAVHIETIT